MVLASPEQIAKLREGADAWNKWRRDHPEIIPQLRSAILVRADLAGVQLGETDLTGANLGGANLIDANLSRATLANANLHSAELGSANLVAANLSRCSLILADCHTADLSHSNLFGAGLLGTNLRSAELSNSNFAAATIGDTVFADNDLSTVAGLETVHHSRPSSIGIDTIYRSKGKIPAAFLRGAGVPQDFIAYIESLHPHAIEFYSCFISYSSKDGPFAKELHAKLQADGVRCWFAPEDLKIGDKFQERIEESIRTYDKLLIVLSENSINSTWVEREVQAAFEKEQTHGALVLFPIRLDDAVMDSQRAWAADIRRTRHIGDFRNWKDHDLFKVALDRLLRDLK